MASTLTPPQSITFAVSARTTTDACLSIGIGALFASLLGNLHLLEPEYDPTWRFVSGYALGDFGWMISLAFAALAASLASVAVVSALQVKRIVGQLRLDSRCDRRRHHDRRKQPDRSTHRRSREGNLQGEMHVAGASLDYAPLGALLISLALSRNPAWKPVRKTLFITAAVTIGATIAFIAALPSDFVFSPGPTSADFHPRPPRD